MKSKVLTTILVVAGLVASLLVIFPSGREYCYQDQCGVMFWGAHEHDAIWHLAVSNTLFSNFPFEMPNMSESMMSGYNYLLDIVIATTSFVTRIPASNLYFQIIPILWFGLFVWLSSKFAKQYHKSKYYLPALLFFSFFGSSLGYLITLKNAGSFWGSSSILSMQPLQNLLNLQFSLSLLPFLAILIGLVNKRRSVKDYVLYGIYAFIAIGLKLYTGVGIVMLLIVDWVIRAIRRKDPILLSTPKLLITGLFSILAVIIFYAPFSQSTGAPFLLDPMATVNPIVEDSSLLYLPKTAERLYSLRGVKLVVIELFVLGLFLVFNFGSRIFAAFGLAGKQEPNEIREIVGLTAIIMLILSILLTQRGVWWNTVQFLYVSLFLFNILAAEGLVKIFQLPKFGIVLGVTIVLITIPTNIDVMRSFSNFPGNSYISSNELSALEFLKKQDPGIVLTGGLQLRGSKIALPPLEATYDTTYVSAYSHKQSYLSDLIQLRLTNIDYHERLEMVSRYDCEVLEDVKYLYEVNESLYVSNYQDCGRGLETIYSNDTASVYLVR
jgi:hypothetical protein